MTSVAATVLLVTVNVAAVVEPAALNSVIAPDVLSSVTPVVRLVACVTAPPAPVAYPTPAVPDDVTAAVTAKLVPVAAPMTGVTSVGLVDNTLLPDPVLAVTPVPPLATGSVPVTPVVKGKPVALVKTPDAGVPSAGVTSVGLVNVGLVSVGLLASTTLPVPVDDVTPVPPRATVRVPVVPATIGNPVAPESDVVLNNSALVNRLVMPP